MTSDGSLIQFLTNEFHAAAYMTKEKYSRELCLEFFNNLTTIHER